MPIPPPVSSPAGPSSTPGAQAGPQPSDTDDRAGLPGTGSTDGTPACMGSAGLASPTAGASAASALAALQALLPEAETWLARARAMAGAGERRLLGLVGPPGAGKSTVAEALAAALNAERPGCAQVVPMDGFHLAQAELERLGRADRKGAPDTFDAAGYAALLQRLRAAEPGVTVYAPAFRREIEEPVAGAIAVPPEVPLLIAEGNYLLLAEGHWARVRPLLDAVWYVQVAPALRLQRLIARHVHHGRSPGAAEAWVLRSDEANARVIEATRGRADAEIALG